MIENIASIVLGVFEIFFFSGICYGFPFLQYVLEDEGVFVKELCENLDVSSNGTFERKRLKLK